MAITKVTEGVRTLGTGEVTTANMATDPTNATNLASGTVADARLGTVPTDITDNQTSITSNQDDIALLGFKVAANGSLARYNLVDQSIDAFEDASGVDASASTNEVRNASKYYSGVQSDNATGGTITTDGSDNIHTFYTAGNSSSTNDFVVPTAGIASVDFLVIAGGGGGGNGNRGRGGGGGAGGYRNSYSSEPSGGGGSSETALTMSVATYAVTVGAGGAGTNVWANKGVDGADSVFSTITSVGGGGGGSYSNGDGSDGGSGGGSGVSGSTEGSGTSNQGYNGGDGAPEWAAGGGGGASAAGANGVFNNNGGDGGNGLASSITGASVTRTGGGGGSSDNPSAGSGGTGGGGDGTAAPSGSGGDGTDNTGSGGGGGVGTTDGSGSGKGGDGGNGIVIARYAQQTAVGNMTLVSNAQTAQSAPTTGDLVITYTDGAGTAVANTNIKAYISRDGSAYTSAVTLASQGTTGGHTILTANGVDLSGIASGTSMRWKIETLVQSVSMDTRIQAVSLGWS